MNSEYAYAPTCNKETKKPETFSIRLLTSIPPSWARSLCGLIFQSKPVHHDLGNSREEPKAFVQSFLAFLALGQCKRLLLQLHLH